MKKKSYELVHFKICELNFELVHVESELSQHCLCKRSVVTDDGGMDGTRANNELYQS